MKNDLASIETLRVLGALAHDCTRCVLSESRTNVVFGAGAPDADVMIVGEAPGQQEDEQGVPFVGRSGQLLDRLLGEIDLARGDVYVANVVKCRPPRNRDPLPDEIDACKGYLRRQIELVDPKVVLTLGNFSMKLLLRTTTGITAMRGTAYEWWGRFLVPTFHPAAALRGGDRVTNDIRADLTLVRNIIDGNVEYIDER
ncbi:MAG: uracil-DNA glycosylase [Actinomycetota bacterium]|nr:uracil-DNA glycosylase [Actinomycetota bacterium]